MKPFALNAGIAGASEVTGLDISEFAVEQATENAKRNSLSDTVTFRAANVLDELPKLAAAGEKYDVVILDPPAFTKSRQATKNAIKGYREINMKGLCRLFSLLFFINNLKNEEFQIIRFLCCPQNRMICRLCPKFHQTQSLMRSTRRLTDGLCQ